MRRASCSVNDISISYTCQGEGPPLLLLHGNGEDGTIFDRVAEQLEACYTVIRPDSRGHGQSQQGVLLSYDRMAQDMAQLIAVLGLKKPAVFGFSDGGIVALLLEIGHPGITSRLMVAGANRNPCGVKVGPLLAMWMQYWETHDPKVRLMLREPHISRRQLNTIAVPTLVLAGSRDLIRSRHTKLLARAIPGATLQIVEGEDHASYVVGSDRLFGLLFPFLQEKTGGCHFVD